MKKIQLIKKTDYDGDWFIIRFTDEKGISKDNFFAVTDDGRGEQKARDLYAKLVANAENVRKETIIDEYTMGNEIDLDSSTLKFVENQFTPDQN